MDRDGDASSALPKRGGANNLIKFKRAELNSQYRPFDVSPRALLALGAEVRRLDEKQELNMRKGSDFLYKEKFSNAYTYFDAVLEENPNYAEAIVGRLEAQLRVSTLQATLDSDELLTACGFLEQAAQCADKELAESIIAAIANKARELFDTDDICSATELYEILCKYDYYEKTETDAVALLALKRLLDGGDTALANKLFRSRLSSFASSDVKGRIAFLENVTEYVFSVHRLSVAEKYNNELLAIDGGNFMANQRRLMLVCDCKNANEFLANAQAFDDYGVFDDILSKSGKDEGECFLKILFDMLKRIFCKDTIATGRPSVIISASMCLKTICKYDSELFGEAIDYVLNQIYSCDSVDKSNIRALFDECLSLIEEDKVKYAAACVRFADNCLRKSLFERAEEKYRQADDIKSTKRSLWGIICCKLCASADNALKYNVLRLEDFDLLDKFLAILSDDDRIEYLKKLIEAVSDAASLYPVTKDNGDALYKLLVKLEARCEKERDVYLGQIKKAYLSLGNVYLGGGEFDFAQSMFAKLAELDPLDDEAIWGKLCCRLKCKDDAEAEKQSELIGQTEEYKFIFANRKGSRDISRYSDVYAAQIEGLKKRAFDDLTLSRFDSAGKLYGKLKCANGFDGESVWGGLCCRLKCKNDESLISQNEIIEKTAEYSFLLDNGKEVGNIDRYTAAARLQRERFLADAEANLKKGKFDAAAVLFAKLLETDGENQAAIWGGLCCRLRCKDDDALVLQDVPVSETEEYKQIVSEADSEATGNNAARYVEVRKLQEERFEKVAKERETQRRIRKARRIAIIVALSFVALIVVILSVSAFVKKESDLVYVNSGDKTFVRAGLFYEAIEVHIPDTYDGNAVYGVAEHGFANKKELRQIYLPKSITEIGNGAFMNCNRLEYVYFGGISLDSFSYCDGGDYGLTVLGDSAFENCTALVRFNLSRSIYSVGNRAFYGSGIREAVIPDLIDDVGNDVFGACENVKEIWLVESGVGTEWDGSWNSGLPINHAYYVNFNFGGAQGSAETQVVKAEESYSFPTPTRKGYAFDGWYSEMYGGGYCFVSGGGKNTGVWEYGKPCTVYANWLANTNTLNFVGGTGTVGKMKSVNAKTDETTTLPKNTFTKTGYTFAGWSTVPNGAVMYSDGVAYKMGADSTASLYAVFIPNLNYLLLSPNGAEGDTVEMQARTDQTVTLPKNKFVWKYHTFMGWAESPYGKVVYADGAEFEMDSEKVTRLYAVWKEDEKFVISGGVLTGLTEYGKTLTTLRVPYNVDTIAKNAFSGATYLQAIYVTEGTTTIERGAFGGCPVLAFVYLSKEVTTVKAYAFYDEFSSALTIYCEAETKPDGWENYWNRNMYSSAYPVLWKQTMPR